jgi:very-short-patch-repair endonuclease
VSHHALLRRRSRNLRREETAAERLIWHLLRDRRLGDLKLRRQPVIGPYIADFVCLDARLVVEIDGDTHVDPVADAKRTEDLERLGYKVIRFWNSYVYSTESAVGDMILEAVKDSALPAAEKARLEREGLFPTALQPSPQPSPADAGEGVGPLPLTRDTGEGYSR